MNDDVLTIRLVFDRTLNPTVDLEWATVDKLQDVLLRCAPVWSVEPIAWNPNAKARIAINFGQGGRLAEVIVSRTKTNLGFNSGSVELRGSTSDFVVVVTVNDRPVRPVGGRLLMPNEITVQLLKPSVEGTPASDFAVEVFESLCLLCAPLWGAVHLSSEYTAKVMQTTPSIRAIGRDFGRFLPGLFAMNYFDNRYIDLLPGPTVLSGIGARIVQRGAFLTVADPLNWEANSSRYSEVMDRLGRKLFFDRTSPERPTVAPNFLMRSD